jgi:hypothetical protein
MQRWTLMFRFSFLINTSLVIASGLASLFLVDWVFIKYEKNYLLSSSKDIQVLENKTFDLASLSFKEQSVSTSKSSNTIRILSIGDSFAYAAVPPPYTYSDVLESLLNQNSSGHNFEVINFGIPGISFPEYIAQFKFWSSKLDFDGVIFNVYTGNDLTDMEWVPYSKREENRFKSGEFFVGRGSWMPRVYPFRFLDYAKAYYSMYMPRVQNLLSSDSQSIKIASMTTLLPTHYFISGNEPPAFYIKAMRRASHSYRINSIDKVKNGYLWLLAMMDLAQQSIDSGKFALILNSPSNLAFSKIIQKRVSELEEISEDSLNPHLPGIITTSLAELFQFKGGIIDPLACLAKNADTGKEIYFSNFSDTHWTREGNEIIARILADYVSNNWLKIKQSTNFSDCSVADIMPSKKMIETEMTSSIYKAWLNEQS